MLNDTTPANEPSKEILGEIEKIKSQIEKRLKAYDEIDAALKAKDWNGAYEIAKEAHINVYDPFAIFREASEAVEHANKSVKDLGEKRGEVRQEKRKLRIYEAVWEKLESWNLALLNLDNKIWDDPISYYSEFSIFLLQAKDVVAEDENKNFSAWANQLNIETEYLKKIDDPDKLRKIKKILVEGQSPESENFTWLYKMHQDIPISQIINRLYAKAEQRFLNQPEPVVAEDYQSNFDSIEKAFKESNQDEFRKTISALETKLMDEKNPLLRRIYQSDVYIWKQRLLAWERAVKLLHEVEGFWKKIDQSVNCANEWADEKNISTLVAALLDLRDIPSEIFALKSNDNSTALEESLIESLGKIASNLENLESDLSGKNRKKAEKSIAHDTSEWHKYFEDMKPWLAEQLEKGQAFMLKLDETSQPAPDISKKNPLTLTANTLNQ